jgi:hypothetical protein
LGPGWTLPADFDVTHNLEVNEHENIRLIVLNVGAAA